MKISYYFIILKFHVFYNVRSTVMKLYTVREAAEEYFAKNVSMSHIYNLIKTKNLNRIHIGHKILIPENALDEYCKANFNIQ